MTTAVITIDIRHGPLPVAVTAFGKWQAGRLFWHIATYSGTLVVSDADLRAWCFRHMPYPQCHVPESPQQLHIEAWAEAQSRGE